jgi:hypothetical protein
VLATVGEALLKAQSGSHASNIRNPASCLEFGLYVCSLIKSECSCALFCKSLSGAFTSQALPLGLPCECTASLLVDDAVFHHKGDVL